MKSYLKKNTLVREDILNLKLFYDLKEASALRQVHLKIFKSDVDINGFDIIIDNNDDLTLKCQVKSCLDAQTKSFQIHSIMLRPNEYLFEYFEFGGILSSLPSDDRGVILIDADIVSDKIITKYYYLDIYLLRAMELGIFKISKQNKTKVSELLFKLRWGRVKSNEKIKVLKSLFFPVKDANALLAIMGFHTIHHINVSNNILQITKIVTNSSFKKYHNFEDRIGDMKGHWDSINEKLEKLLHPEHKLIRCKLNDNYFNDRL